MGIILLLTVTASIMVTVGCLGMFISTTKRISDLERDLRSHRAEISEHKRRIGIIEKRDASKSDKIVIVHGWDDSSAPNFPSKEGF